MVIPFLAAGPQAGSQATLGTDETGSLAVSGTDTGYKVWARRGEARRAGSACGPSA